MPRLAERASYPCEYCNLDMLASVENYKLWQKDHIIPTCCGGMEEFQQPRVGILVNSKAPVPGNADRAGSLAGLRNDQRPGRTSLATAPKELVRFDIRHQQAGSKEYLARLAI